jgi:alkanesulfonate monooxygenase SsuD/methylene tetrahydromethanopterin reductase-like flavin-dependent oxidoreductase (luciferase family)
MERRMTVMKGYALFANFENPFGNTRRALHESIETVILAEQLGFEQVWLTEHHFNAFSVSAALFPLLANLAAQTSRIGLGAGALLLPFHDPVRVAEDIATVDALSGGRLLLGVGKGGPFPDQFRHFGVAHDASRARLFEALALLEKLLGGTSIDHDSPHHHYRDLSVYPRPIRPQLPIWLASLNEASVSLAAARGYGLMGPSAAPVEKIRSLLAGYRPHPGDAAPPFVLARYFLCHPDGERARREALPFIRDFAGNMRAARQQIPSANGPIAPFGQDAAAFGKDSLLANAIVGSPAACIAQCRALQAAIGPHVLLLKPASYDPKSSRRSLSLFAEQIYPHLGSHCAAPLHH